MSTLEKLRRAAVAHERASNHKRATQLRLEKMIRMAAAEGHSKSEIARIAGVSRPTVYSNLPPTQSRP